MDTFREFLKRVFEATGISTQSELSKVLGVNRSNITHAKNKGEAPENWAYKMSTIYGLNPEWLLTGQGDVYSIIQNEYKRIPKLTARLSAGAGSFETEVSIKDHFLFQKEWLKQKGRPDQMVMLDVWGDSMEPELRDGDSVLIDRSNVQLSPGTIFALGIDDAILIKRVEPHINKLILHSENKKYSPIILKEDEVNRARIIGKIIWVCRNYK